jgi:hypothetical protein
LQNICFGFQIFQPLLDDIADADDADEPASSITSKFRTRLFVIRLIARFKPSLGATLIMA